MTTQHTVESLMSLVKNVRVRVTGMVVHPNETAEEALDEADAALQLALTEVLAELAMAKSEAATWHSQVKYDQDETKTWQRMYDTIAAKCDVQSDRIVNLDSKIEKLQLELAEAQKELYDLKGHGADVALNTLQSKCDEQARELEVRKSYADEQTDFAIKNANERDTLQSKLTDAQGLAGGYASENLRLQSKCDEQAAEIERLNRTTCACRFDNGENTEQCKLHGAWCDTLHEQADYRRERDQLRAKVAEMEAQEPIGEMREEGVVWFGKNPHAFPIGTRYFVAPGAAQEKTE